MLCLCAIIKFLFMFFQVTPIGQAYSSVADFLSALLLWLFCGGAAKCFCVIGKFILYTTAVDNTYSIHILCCRVDWTGN
jgi:hypothetical protein